MKSSIFLHAPSVLFWALSGLQGLAASELVTIDFQNFAPMQAIAGSPVPAESQLSNQLLASQGVSFYSESASPFVAVVDLGGGGIGIAGVDDNHNLSYGTLFRINLFMPSQPNVPAATDFVSIHPAAGSPLGFAYAITAFDVDETYLSGDFNLTLQGAPVNVSWANAEIHSVQVFGSIAFDDFTFNSPLTPVPEPSILAIILLPAVLCLAGITRRRIDFRKA
jgi:hypothetical protein